VYGWNALLTLQSFTDEELEYTRNKFGSQKGISSDEFFGREGFDPAAQAEAKSRLGNFEGQTSISSNAYFGRPEEDLPAVDEYGNYGDLEGAAKDFVRRFGITAGDDLENLSQVLGDGASMLQGKSPFIAMWKLFFFFPVSFPQRFRI
jgi:ADP-ribosylation factor GTPase-activating protein 2/3